MAKEELDDIAEDLADKLGIYGEERSHWTYEFKRRVRDAIELERKLLLSESNLPKQPQNLGVLQSCGYCRIFIDRQCPEHGDGALRTHKGGKIVELAGEPRVEGKL